MTSRDKTLVLGAGSQTFSNSAYTAANPTVITSKVENVATAHSLNTNDKIVVLRSDDTTRIPEEAIYLGTDSMVLIKMLRSKVNYLQKSSSHKIAKILIQMNTIIFFMKKQLIFLSLYFLIQSMEI